MKRNDKPDQSFNSIAKKFESNIYGSTKGQLRHELLFHYLGKVVNLNAEPLNILDAGGGTGVMSKPLLSLGHKVTLNDMSEEVLALAEEKLVEFENFSIAHGPIQTLEDTQQYDLVVCHAVLEWLQDPMDVVDKLLGLLKPGGFISLSFFNKDAHRFGNLLYGNFDYVKADLKNKNTVRLNPNNALVPRQLIDALKSRPVTLVHKAGIRCIHDYLKDPQVQTTRYQEVKEMELQYGASEPYLWLGKYFHIIARKHD